MFDDLRSRFAEIEQDIENGPIVPLVTPDEVRDHLARYDFKRPMPLDEVGADVEEMMRKWHVQVTHPRYLGLFNPSVTFPSVVAETLVAMYNPQLAAWRTSPAANEIERHTLTWLAAKFGLPAGTSSSFTSGGSEANLSAVVVALTRTFPEYAEQGARHVAAQPAIYAAGEAHHGFNKICKMTGIGRNALRKVAVDDGLRLDPEDLAKQVSEDRKKGLAPFMVVATAGTTGAGVIDPLPELAQYCRSENLWLHVDAAWGGAAILSPTLRRHLQGIGDADSVTCDAHKWFSVPMGAGMFFCRHPEAVSGAFQSDNTFMPPRAGPVTDPYSTSPQWSRRFIGLKLFLALAQLGECGYARMIEHQAQMGDVLRESLQATGWRIVNNTPLPVVCFTRDGLDTAKFLKDLHARQIAWMSQVSLNDIPPVIRACVTSFRTTDAHIRCIVREMNSII